MTPHIIADSERIHGTLGWQPRFDDLADIVAHALDWERELMTRRDSDATLRVSQDG